MIKNGMNGKCFNVIKSMYQNIKSCVTQNGVNSDFFSCSIGSVKGKTYAFLFAVFINDLETFLDIHEAPSLQTIDNLFDEYLNILMKTFLLLYADDTLLFSETYEGMQNLLNVITVNYRNLKLT
jgi:galactitol-specific phosphotransferase system IIB component